MVMGLDIGFYKNGEELLYLRNHDEFLDLFINQEVQRVRPDYDDFYVDMRVLNGVAADLREDVREHGLTKADLPDEVPASFWHLNARATPWEILLPVYPLLVWSLRSAVYERGTLICGWSA